MAHEHHTHEDCKAMFDKLSEYLDSELDAVSCEQIEKHARRCKACEACLETLRKTIALCREMKPHSPSERFSRRLKSIITQVMAAEQHSDRSETPPEPSAQS